MANTDLSADRLRELLHYDQSTGIFTWAKDGARTIRAGNVAGYPKGRGYWMIHVDGRMHLSHRLAWLHVTGKWPTGQIDHINGDRGDNRIANLRDVPQSTNQQNQRRAHATSQSGVLGVSKVGNWFKARIRENGQLKNLGKFGSAEDAHAAYLARKRQIHAGCTI